MLRRSLVRPLGLLTAGLLASLLTVACGGDDDDDNVAGAGGAAGKAGGGAGGVAGSVTAGAGGSTAGAAGNGQGGTINPQGGAGGIAGGAGKGGGGAGGKPPAACGDGVLDPEVEACDDGNGKGMDGCSADCKAIESGYVCSTPGQPCVSTVVCGDKKITGSETCDDGNAKAGDGCSADCKTEPGWTCTLPGIACVAAECGDGIVAGKEQCDDKNSAKPGCSATCQLEDGYQCPTAGADCVKTTCGDGKTEGTEQCDDKNNNMGDGCTPFCKREPDCSGGACKSVCGDGIRLATDTSEECEDGNTQDGDGCSHDCKIEPGYSCTPNTTVPTKLNLPLVLRDFSFLTPDAGKKPLKHPDFETYNCGVVTGMAKTKLDAEGKPALQDSKGCITSADSYKVWYRDSADYNQTFLQTLTLNKQADGTYQFANTEFFPLDNKGFGNQGNNHNFHFTSEVRYYFEYKGGEKLSFKGDDDVWVFVNRTLAVDLGGVHGVSDGSVLLGDVNNSGTIDGGEGAATTDSRFGITKGNVYEIVVFQAERHTNASNYLLTLGGFVNSTTTCKSECGNGVVTPDEQCDDGANTGGYNKCGAGCKYDQFCGDGKVQSDQEQCDDGTNLTTYSAKGEGCAPGCLKPAFCGDGKLDGAFGEACDLGTDKNTGAYGGCKTDCTLAPRCGDGIIQQDAGETCDDGNTLNGDGCAANCKPDGIG